MTDLARIKRNVAKMAAQNAPIEDIDGYILSEGVTIDDVRNFKPLAIPALPEGENSQGLRSELSGMTQNPAKALYDQRPEWHKPIQVAQDIFDVGLNGASMGFANKGAALARSVVTGKSYDDELEGMKARTQAARDRSGSAGFTAELGAGIAVPMVLAAKGVTLAGRLGTGAMTGAKGVAARSALLSAEGAGYGAASAIGNDTDIGQGMVYGAAGGATVPVISGIGNAVGKPLVDAVRARVNPGAYATEKVAERLGNSMSPQQAGNRLASNPGSTLADVGGRSTRDLLRTTSNIPGPAKDRLASQLTLRQFGQGDRLKSAISKTFADPDGYLTAKDEIVAEARRVAAPLYEQAYRTPVHFSESLEGILNTPAGRSALRKANELAGNEQVPFQQLFVSVADDGASATARRVPDARAWDYIKRAMDDMIEAQTDSITKKVTNEGRILVNLKNKMLSEIDKVNPAYKAARQAFAGQAQLDEALETGREIFKMSPEGFKRAVDGMSDAQKATARIGAAESLRNQIDRAGATHNSLLRIFSTPTQVRNLQTLFETPETFAEFRKTIWSEARKRSTYEAIKGNSTTASQLVDLMETGGLREGVDVAKNLVTGGPVNATLNFVGSRLRMLGGMTPEVADQIARQLMTSSPNAAKQLTTELSRIQRARLSAEQKRQAVQAMVIRSLAVLGGSGIATSAAAEEGERRISLSSSSCMPLPCLISSNINLALAARRSAMSLARLWEQAPRLSRKGGMARVPPLVFGILIWKM